MSCDRKGETTMEEEEEEEEEEIMESHRSDGNERHGKGKKEKQLLTAQNR